MKKFVITFLKFTVPILVTFFVLSFSLKMLVNTKCSYKFDKKYATIILGHSQPEQAFNDSLMQNVKNFGAKGEAYVYTLQKLKKITSENPQVKTIVLSFSNNQIEGRMNDWSFDEVSMNNYYAKYSFIMDKEDYALFIKNSFKNLLSAELNGIVMNAKCIYKGANRIENKDFGGYMYKNKSKIDSLISHHSIDQLKKRELLPVSDVNILYLKKIVAFCKVKQLKLIFFRAPVHKMYFSIVNESKYQSIRKSNFNDIPFIDLHDYPLSNDEFADFVHLNYKGARKFSVYFNELLKHNDSIN